MAVTPYDDDPASAEAFLAFRDALYPEVDAALLQRAEITRLLGPASPFHAVSENRHRSFLATNGERVLGHVTAFVNRRLKDGEGRPLGALGFFDCVEDRGIAAELLGAAIDWLRHYHGLSRVWGPIQFDIWHGYRFKTHGFGVQPFSGEPLNKPYYPAFFEDFGFTPMRQWNSVWIADRRGVQDIIARAEPERRRQLDQGYRFTGLREASDLRQLHAAVMQAFSDLPAFTAVTFEEFAALLSAKGRDDQLITLVRNGEGALASFAVAYPDTMSAGAGRTAVFYLIGTTGKHNGDDQLLARSTVYHTIQRCFEAGYAAVICAMMRKVNWLHGFEVKHIAEHRCSYLLYEFVA